MSRPISRALQQEHSAPGVKQQLAAIRMLFDWLVIGQVLPTNPAAAVRGPKHVVKTGKTPVLEGAEWRKLLDSIPATTLRDLRDRALIATLTYSFARINAALKMKVEDLRPRGAGWTIRLHEKGGKQHAMPCHHALAEALRAYIDAAGIAEDRKGWLFRTARGHNGSTLSDKPMSQPDAWRMIRRRARRPASPPKSATTPSGRPGSPPISPMAARLNTPRRWPRMRVRARPSSMTAPRNGSRRTRWSGSGCNAPDTSPKTLSTVSFSREAAMQTASDQPCPDRPGRSLARDIHSFPRKTRRSSIREIMQANAGLNRRSGHSDSLCKSSTPTVLVFAKTSSISFTASSAGF